MDSDRQDLASDRFTWLAGMTTLIGAYVALRAMRRARRPLPAQGEEKPPRALILGGGFAGLEAARALQRLLPGRCEVVLIDRHNYHLFTPLLYQVASCGVDPYSITYPLRHVAERSGVVCRTATISGINFERRRVILQEGGEVGYDYLVIALGSSTDFDQSPSAPEHAMPLKTAGDGLAIRNHVLDALEKGAAAADPIERNSLLTFTVVGGGSTGVETAAALSELLIHATRLDYPDIDSKEVRIILVEASGKLLGEMGGPAASKALERLRKKGVEVWLDSRATGAAPDCLSIEGGRTLATRTIIWTAGVRAAKAVADLDAPHGDKGSLLVNQFLQVRGRPGVYAVGDCAHVDDSIARARVPWLADAAIQEGRTAAENISRVIAGRPQNPFHYRKPGTLLSLGRNDALAQFGRLVLSGTPGAVAWHAVHLFKIPTLRERLSTALDWSAGYVADKDTARLEVRPEEERVGEGESGGGRE